MAKRMPLVCALCAVMVIALGHATVAAFAQTQKTPVGVHSGDRPGRGCDPPVATTGAPVRPQGAPPALPNLTGTYSGSDGGIYYMQQSGSLLWWAGLSVNPKVPLEQQWHRGLDFTNVFRGTVYCDGQIVGNWADVPKGAALAGGTLTLAVRASGGETEITQTTSTGGFTAQLWRRGNTGIDDLAVNKSTAMDIVARFDAVNKNSNDTLHDNLKPYRDATVLYGRVITTQPNFIDDANMQPPHVNYGPDYHPVIAGFRNFGGVARDVQEFCRANDANLDGDFDFRVKIDLRRMEPDFFATGWGDRSNGPTVFRQKFGRATQDPSFASTEAYLGAEAIMYGLTGRCDRGNFGPAVLPGWADHASNSMLVNGRPVDGAARRQDPDPACGFIQPCPVVVFRHPLNNGIQLGKLMITAEGQGTFMRLTGPLVLDCGHSTVVPPERDPCYDEVDDLDRVGKNQNQEMHAIYSMDIINYPFRPEDADVVARKNLTGTWGGSDGSTYYIHQIGNTIWWLGQLRERQPMQRGTAFPIIGALQFAPAFSAGRPPCDTPNQCWAFATVFQGTISDLPDGSATIAGEWGGVPQSTSQGNTGSKMTFTLDRTRKKIVPSLSPTIFPSRIEKMYEPDDVTPPTSVATVAPAAAGAVGGVTATGPKQVTITATDQGSGVQNIWYRFSANGAAPPAAFTFAPGATTSFTLPRGSFRVDFYATDNAGNDEAVHSTTVGLVTKQP